jgi:DNA-binding transcriptional LysR family regulator
VELRHLRYFVAVAEMGSVSRAAEKLFIAQPPLSTQIKQLEDEVGVKLLIRYSRGVRLTTAGAAFLGEAKDLLARSERAKRLARHNGSALGGAVRIGYVPSAGHTVLPRLLRQIRQLRPDGEIDVCEMITPQQVQALCAGDIDVGLARAPINSGRITVVAELDDRFAGGGRFHLRQFGAPSRSRLFRPDDGTVQRRRIQSGAALRSKHALRRS